MFIHNNLMTNEINSVNNLVTLKRANPTFSLLRNTKSSTRHAHEMNIYDSMFEWKPSEAQNSKATDNYEIILSYLS